jgi:predicted phage-related endonuclease
MTLTPEQLAKRGEIGASDVPVMVCGTDHELLTKWREMCGLQAREDYTNNWRVQFGNHLEQFGLDWHERKLGYDLIERGEVYRHPKLDFLTCTIDAFDPVRDAVIEFKTTAWSGEWAERYYASQLYVQRACRGCRNAIMVLCVGGNEPVEIEYDFDQHFYDEMLARVAAFKLCMETMTPPVVLPQIAPPEQWRTIDLALDTTLNQRSELIDLLLVWDECKDVADRCAQAADAAKSLIPPDVGRLRFNTITINRDKRGHLSIRRAA